MAVPLPVDLSRPRSRFTVEDWLNLPEAVGQRVELIDGSFVVSPTPMSTHQICAKRLVRILDDAAPHHMEAVENFGVRAANEAVIPDVVVGDAEALFSGTSALLPDQTFLVAEVVSPGNRYRDYQDKPRIYAAAGIPTFLRIELIGVNAPYVEVLKLRDGAYVHVETVEAGQKIKLTEPFPVEFDPAQLLGRRPG